MNKYLFTDRTNAVREVQSQKELQQLIDASEEPSSIRIWLFNSQAWLDYNDYLKKTGAQSKKLPTLPAQSVRASRAQTGQIWLKKFLLTCVLIAGIFLVYNFARIKWIKASAISVVASRPENVPVMDLDSLLQSIEFSRGQKLDKITRNNLRIRNSWPERIVAQLTANRDSSSSGIRFYDLQVSLDNSTGYMIDNAVMNLTTWKNGEPQSVDTIQFSNISYALASTRELINAYKGDSLSIAFELIKAKAFNFCYSANKKNNTGSSADKWFCREGNSD